LRDLDYVEGRNLAFDYGRAEGQYSRLPALAQQLVRSRNDLIVSAGASATRAAKNATATVPIVMVVGSDPVEAGLIPSLAHPNGNITGLSTSSVLLSPKRLELLRDIAPTINTVAAVANTTSANNQQAVADIEAAARALGFKLQLHGITTPEDLAGAFAAIKAEGTGWVIVLTSTMFFRVRRQIADLAAASKLATMLPEREFVEAGGLMSYSPSYTEMYRIAAGYIDRIFKGATPADLPVQQPTKFELVINLKTAKALGLTVPPSLLARADEVIE
jgi:putative ABC transport system substrate-binding protein